MKRWLANNINKCTIFSLFFLLVFSQQVTAQTLVQAVKIKGSPQIDGNIETSIWNQTTEVIIRDDIANLEIKLKAVYNDSRIYFLVQFPDPDESRIHKPWTWNKSDEIYEIGNKREDSFVFKWSLVGNDIDLSLISGTPHRADIWYWKANRTDPAGYADDKMHTLSESNCQKCTTIPQKNGDFLYLQRHSDFGKSAYKIKVPMGYEEDEMMQFLNQKPTDSRADIQAKGQWLNGIWTIEFARLLDTGNQDDIKFVKGKKYLFGLSRYEVAGKKPNPAYSQPLYNSGDITNNLILHLQ